jgi:hypothetical protein
MGLRGSNTRSVGGNEPPRVPTTRARRRRERAERRLGRLEVRDPLPEDIRDPSCPAAVRGYDRRAVDVYAQRVNRLIAELQVSGSPRAAVRHALDRVGEQTSGILQRARETAEEIATSAREEAEDATARARAEAQDTMRAQGPWGPNAAKCGPSEPPTARGGDRKRRRPARQPPGRPGTGARRRDRGRRAGPRDGAPEADPGPGQRRAGRIGGASVVVPEGTLTI